MPQDDLYVTVSCGAGHTVAVTNRGKVYSWGDSSQGQLGHGTMVQECPEPKLIDVLLHIKIVYVSCGDSHTALVSGKVAFLSC